MSGLPDSEAERCESIVVFRTPELDNPKFGAVTIRFTRGYHSNTIRISADDARLLVARVGAHLDGEGGAA